MASTHNIGDIHPNGKWVWSEYQSGHFGWVQIAHPGAAAVDVSKL